MSDEQEYQWPAFSLVKYKHKGTGAEINIYNARTGPLPMVMGIKGEEYAQIQFEGVPDPSHKLAAGDYYYTNMSQTDAHQLANLKIKSEAARGGYTKRGLRFKRTRNKYEREFRSMGVLARVAENTEGNG